MLILNHIKNIIKLFMTLALIPVQSLACSPLMPTMVPPTEPGGEFTYIYPPTALEQFIEDLSKSKSHAVVLILLDQHSQSHPHDARTKFKVLYGWGQPKAELHTIMREETSCGKPAQIVIDAWYVAIFPAYGSPYLMPYKDLESQISTLGEPTYVYTSVGRLPR